MNHASAASIKAHQQEDAAYDYNSQQQYQNQYRETYTAQNQQTDPQNNHPQNQNFLDRGSQDNQSNTPSQPKLDETI